MKKKKIELSQEQREKIIEEIISFFYNERNEEIGELAAILLLDFFTKKIGPFFYNEGIKDAIKFMQERVEDMFGLEI
ncbi:MAG: DUF2164 domain-containing protein [Candidatus Cloacimonetes bacterium]|nr:DUF2164 domain-containing protein [Candidatus Cloacimonadota bacterium]MCF7813177.1 DUF2164 domain-containing protein [Candidatus Cloacimonadota bacterium]MCF7867625.1 DUF2164 domain-containing protein [Candidatus Cloacimonadota bacterium]MCF7883100.1 DUF2164 domain-containing protein [Candidatus Cloacimonadota bacterium]